jgi:hypothetical protein
MASPARLLALSNLSLHAVRSGACDPDEGAAQLVHLSFKVANLLAPNEIINPSRLLPLHVTSVHDHLSAVRPEAAQAELARLHALQKELDKAVRSQLTAARTRRRAAQVCRAFNLATAEAIEVWVKFRKRERAQKLEDQAAQQANGSSEPPAPVAARAAAPEAVGPPPPKRARHSSPEQSEAACAAAPSAQPTTPPAEERHAAGLLPASGPPARHGPPAAAAAAATGGAAAPSPLLLRRHVLARGPVDWESQEAEQSALRAARRPRSSFLRPAESAAAAKPMAA